jgi:hypothetical protein
MESDAIYAHVMDIAPLIGERSGGGGCDFFFTLL